MFNLIVTGNLTKDATHRVTANGKDVLSFTIAVNHGSKESPRVDYIDCSIWGDRAKSKLGEYLVKGQKVLVDGIPGVNAYIGKEDSAAHGTLTLMVGALELLGSSSGGAGNGAAPAARAPAARAPAAAPAAAGAPDDLDW
jgi:single-strand DNA-binding protein